MGVGGEAVRMAVQEVVMGVPGQEVLVEKYS